MKKIAFILPMPTLKIVGGYKVVYEYANYFVSEGYKVTIFYNSDKGKNSKKLPKFLVYKLRNVICKREPTWFDLSSKVKKVNLYALDKEKLEDFDVVFATAAETAIFVNSLNVNKKIYLIQDFESNWRLSKTELIKTYNYPNMDLVVISKWLQKKVQHYTDKKVRYISDGIDENIFFDYNSKRPSHSLCILYHLDKRKGWDVAEKVILNLKNIYPDLTVNVFGSPKKPKNWPKWFNYVRNAHAKQVANLMNNSKVFLCTSRKEGFGLTGLESLFCGCTLVTTDCGGIREYASEENAFICKVDDVQSITTGVVQAFTNNDLVSKYNLYNKKNINKFSLKNSYKKINLEIDNNASRSDI